MKQVIITFILALFCTCEIMAYEKADSVRVESILAKTALLNESENKLLSIARDFIGTPYVASTLDKDSVERLVINTRELDCTTYVENVVALYMCFTRGERTFDGYAKYLQQIRYRKGNIAYADRLHYFTSWIEDNEEMGFVKKVESSKAPFTAVQKLNINYMTKHYAAYNMLKGHKEWLPAIRKTEQELTGRTYRYIPKNDISNTQLMRATIHDGDIIAILTSKTGLDTSHIGIAVWHKDGLHLLNASQIHKRVIEEPMLLRTYMKKHPTQIGIRICRILEK